jgi:hypothetical protein
MTELRLDWCSYEAAKYAVEHWHYSRAIPIGKQVRIGVWESSVFIGVLLFAPGACAELGSPYGLGKYEVCELVRIALQEHKTPVSKLLGIALKMLKKSNPGIRLIVSFADPSEGHHGGIYQATNWIYNGDSGTSMQYWFREKWTHPKTFRSEWAGLQWVDLSKLPTRKAPGKHRYLYPLDNAMRAQIKPLAKPYPKRERGETDNAPQSNAETDGASPIRSLLKVTA